MEMNEKIASNFKIINTIVLTGIFIIAILIYIKFDITVRQNNVELTYKIYNDMIIWKQKNPEAANWLNEPDTLLGSNYYKWKIIDYLAYFEMVYSMERRGLADEDLDCELFSYELENIYKANNFELKKMIQSFRDISNDPEIFAGLEKLYNSFMKKRKYYTK